MGFSLQNWAVVQTCWNPG